MMSCTDIKIFVDTNIIAYMFDSRDKTKQYNARMLFTELASSKRCCISTQVLQESFNVLTKKLRYTKDEASGIVSNLMNLTVHQITTSDVVEAMRISRSTQYTIYDSMILAAAKAEGCVTVYSEDLNDGQEVNGVKIENPLISSFPPPLILGRENATI